MMSKSVCRKEAEKKSKHKMKRTVVLFVGLAVACLVLSNYSAPRSYVLSQVSARNTTTAAAAGFEPEGIVKTQLDIILENASTKDKNVIITNLNDAWVEPHSIFDLFLESFHIGNNTRRLLNHLVVVCLDEKAYNRCLALHPHCYQLRIEGLNSAGEAFFMSPDYLEIVWKKIDFLATILEKGYNFIFTDTDIMWLRDPFPRFDPEADFQTSCDMFFGNSSSINNLPNTGFNYVKSNNRTIQFLKFWYNSRKTYPNLHDQDVFKKIVNNTFITEIGVRLGFLNTAYFGGFCEPSKDFNLVCTMHANCCVGLKKKVHDLQTMLEDWRRFMSFDPSMQPNSSWSVPRDCRSLSSRISSRQGNSTMKSSKKRNRRKATLAQ
ncbi:hypothetical protein FNV43_RR21098 [Rhamnella rubrinervis]|uniref:Nucleotide-diphospho-sugar transferase domain-containing protein n=1 Tax=Rhamnella rubrinervis TaxID=2594499 RepID=A0A8K0DX80_9ROSA|nr:hypothetical protein FNV43_RR21098 [Rhamnella rubrinervis]